MSTNRYAWPAEAEPSRPRVLESVNFDLDAVQAELRRSDRAILRLTLVFVGAAWALLGALVWAVAR